MKNINKYFALSILLTVALCSCVKQDLYDISDPDKGAFKITADWSNRGNNIDLPNNLTAIYNGKSLKLQDSVYSSGKLFPGGYHMNLYSLADKITVDGTIAKVKTIDGFVDPMPGWFFSWREDYCRVNAGSTTDIRAMMVQQTRQLTIDIEVVAGDASQIKSVSGTIEGVASTLDIDSLIYGSPAKVATEFTVSGINLVTTLRLLGIVESQTQKITLYITYMNNTTGEASGVFNSKFANFNSNKEIPFTISAGLSLGTPAQPRSTNSDVARITFL